MVAQDGTSARVSFTFAQDGAFALGVISFAQDGAFALGVISFAQDGAFALGVISFAQDGAFALGVIYIRAKRSIRPLRSFPSIFRPLCAAGFFFVFFSVGAGGPETVHRALVLAIVAGFVTIEKFLGAGLVTHGAEGERGVADGTDFGGIVIIFATAAQVAEVGGFLSAGFDGELLLLDADEPQTAPFGQCHGFDIAGFDGGDGLKFLLKRGQDVGEALGGFTVKNDGFGKDSVPTRSASGCFGISRIRRRSGVPDRFTVLRECVLGGASLAFRGHCSR